MWIELDYQAATLEEAISQAIVAYLGHGMLAARNSLLFCPPQICFRSSTKSASKLGMAQTTPDRAKSRNAGAFSRVTTWKSSAARVGP